MALFDRSHYDFLLIFRNDYVFCLEILPIIYKIIKVHEYSLSWNATTETLSK